MKILSFDVGIKNISYCHFEKEKIIDWGIIDVSSTKTCQCGNNAVFANEDGFFCKKHKPEGLFIEKEIGKMKLKDYKQLDDLHGTRTKKEWNQFFKETVVYYPLKNNASTLNLIDISRNIQSKFDEKWEGVFFDVVIIENQIGPLAVRMKTIQGMITQYFVKIVPDICFVNPCNKVKGKMTYKERKKEGIVQCNEILKSHEEWITFFEKNKKKDDLADCLLQGVWFIKNKLGNLKVL